MKRDYIVRVPRPDGPPFTTLRAAETPEAAAETVLLTIFGQTRPAMAPERVDEWADEPRIFFRREGAEVDPRACAERGLRHLVIARKALAHFDTLNGPEARRARGLAAELDELGARLQVLAGDCIAPGAGAPR